MPKCFQLQQKNVNVFERTQKRTKADESVCCVFQPLNFFESAYSFYLHSNVKNILKLFSK